ncbi:hypothetical protein C8R47DRAFT_1325934 [Mycena vitilis]|nr:hypothetical protein C8R47DRAFT_1325934 [Mycena vitilis]
MSRCTSDVLAVSSAAFLSEGLQCIAHALLSFPLLLKAASDCGVAGCVHSRVNAVLVRPDGPLSRLAASSSQGPVLYSSGVHGPLLAVSNQPSANVRRIIKLFGLKQVSGGKLQEDYALRARVVVPPQKHRSKVLRVCISELGRFSVQQFEITNPFVHNNGATYLSSEHLAGQGMDGWSFSQQADHVQKVLPSDFFSSVLDTTLGTGEGANPEWTYAALTGAEWTDWDQYMQGGIHDTQQL